MEPTSRSNPKEYDCLQRRLLSCLFGSRGQVPVSWPLFCESVAKQCLFYTVGMPGAFFSLSSQRMDTFAPSPVPFKSRREGVIVVSYFFSLGCDAGTDKEGMTEGDRDRVVDEFKKGNTTILITTNVLSRGFDVLSVSNVINYTVPTNQDGSVDIRLCQVPPFSTPCLLFRGICGLFLTPPYAGVGAIHSFLRASNWQMWPFRSHRCLHHF